MIATASGVAVAAAGADAVKMFGGHRHDVPRHEVYILAYAPKPYELIPYDGAIQSLQ